MKYYDKLIFEISKPGRIGYSLQQSDFGNYSLTDLPQSLRRGTEAELPEASELDVVRHYTNVSNKNFGVETGFYPLGSCTMKYNPKINEEMASMESFTALHPLQSENSIQGALRLYYELAHALSEISGLAEFTLNPFAGAHGELTGLMLMRQYHIKRGDLKRTKVIVPDSAHGTNPASAAVCGLEIVEVPSTPEGTIDVTKLEPLLDDTIAGIMMTNPNTLGIFEKEIPQIAELVHGCGGLLYYDGANLNPLLGRCAYILSLGKEQIKHVGELATLNANYVKESLKDCYYLPIEGICKHEFVFDGLLDKSTGVTTLDIAKRLLDYGYHAPTIYFPLLFHQSIMIEPTETESKETLDEFIEVMRTVAHEAIENPDLVKSAPHSTPVRRLDETTAAKNPILRFKDLQKQS